MIPLCEDHETVYLTAILKLLKSGWPQGCPRDINKDGSAPRVPARYVSPSRSDRLSDRLCELLNELTDWIFDLSWVVGPIRTTTTWDNGYGPLCVVRFFRKLCQTSSSALRPGRTGAIQPGWCLASPCTQRPEGHRAMAQDP